MATDAPEAADALPRALWAARIPLLITHARAPAGSAPFVASVPRFSYLAQLLPRLRAFFAEPSDDEAAPPPPPALTSFHHEDVPLRALAVGLLADLYRPALPWRLVVSDGEGWHVGDTFLNGAKEADFVRRGNAKVIMGLSKDDTGALWESVLDSMFLPHSGLPPFPE
jgi:autophagy-related protein 5